MTPPDPIDLAGRPGAAVPVAPVRDRQAERAQLERLAQEFEAMLMNEMLSGWRESLSGDHGLDGETSDGANGLGAMTDMVGTEFGRALSRSGGLGIAKILLRSFDRSIGGPVDSTREAPRPMIGAGQPAPSTASARVVSAPPAAAPDESPIEAVQPFEGAARQVDGPVTSGFGWRPDPFTGRVKFHAGADVRMAYGQDVTAVADGRVAFAGDQAGYGLTVVVDHENGLETRYAHLSHAGVQAGDPVAAGQVIAQSGSSGRSTGPHLHVELRNGGRAVDPAALLKSAGGRADWKAYRSPVARSTQESAIRNQE